jgi:hypothetical protein
MERRHQVSLMTIPFLCGRDPMMVSAHTCLLHSVQRKSTRRALHNAHSVVTWSQPYQLSRSATR